MYITPNYKSKAAANRAIKAGVQVRLLSNSPFDKELLRNGSECVEGPHFPKPHIWYGQAIVKNGIVIKIK